jgi:2-methylcitrate dehydratase PrpD
MDNIETNQACDALVSARLSEFIVAARWEDIPEAVRHEAKRSLMNFFATSLGGCKDEAVATSSAVLKPFAASHGATIIGRAEKTDMLNAAFLNAMSANVFDFDDTHERTIIHPTAPVAPALLAHAETSALAGTEFLLGLVLGIETECRIGNAVSPGHYRRGWHITSTCGVFGSAVGMAKVLKLDSQRIRWALGNASAQAGGLVETLGSMSKSISVGNSARNGALSALLAQQNFSGPAQPLEGPRGFLHVTADNPDFSEMTEDLGDRWEALKNTYKPYPCGIVLNPVIEACIELQRNPLFSISEVERVELVGHPLLRERTDRPNIQSGRQAQVSAQHSVAVSLATGRARLQEFTDERVADPSLRAFGSKVHFVDDADFAVDSARVSLFMRDGKVLSHTVDSARGSSANPLPDAQLEKKLIDLAEFGETGVDARRLIDAIWGIDRATDVGAIMSIAAGKK